MKQFFLLLAFFLFLNCQGESHIDLDQIDGYWQIEFVQQKDEIFESKQSFLLYDYYSTQNNTGIYKKVAPQINGSFKTSDSAIRFEILKTKGDFILQFTSPWNTWFKTIKYLDSKKLVLFHQDRSFHYKRPLISKTLPENE